MTILCDHNAAQINGDDSLNKARTITTGMYLRSHSTRNGYYYGLAQPGIIIQQCTLTLTVIELESDLTVNSNIS